MDLENSVFKADSNLAVCWWKECKDRGNYRRCYFNELYVICPKYLTHQNYLKTIQKMVVKMKEDLEKKAAGIIIKGKTEISCDNINCELYGEIWWCYKNKQESCGIYREWENKNQ